MTAYLPLWLAATGAGDANLTSIPDRLSTADHVLFVVALLILVLSSGSWLFRSRRDPLEGAPVRPNRVREDSVALAVVVFLMAGLLAGWLARGLTGETEGVLLNLIVGNAAQAGGIAACLFVAAKRFEGGVPAFWFGRPPMRPYGIAATILGVTLVAVAFCPLIRDATAWAILAFDPGFEFKTHPTVAALHDGSQPAAIKVAFWIGAAALAPAAEELFFRGLMQTFLVSFLRRRWPAILIVAVVFGSVHYPQPSTIPALTALGILMGFAYEKTGSLIPPVAIHALFNLKTLIWDALGNAAV